MKKKLYLMLLSVLTMFTLCANAFAVDIPESTYLETIDLGDGFYMVVSLVEHPTTFASNTASKTKEGAVYDGSTQVGTVKLVGRFTYNGSSATATSGVASGSGKNGWSYTDGSASCSGNTVTGTYKFKSSSGTNKTFYLKMTCSANGSIS